MIPRLEDLSLGRRVVLTAVIVIAAILLLAAVGFLSGRWEAQGQELPSKYDAHLIERDKVALESAYHDQLKVLFGVWLKDGAGREATRISNGLQIARRAYVQAAGQIEAREAQIKSRAR
jgi:hypothetical protein